MPFLHAQKRPGLRRCVHFFSVLALASLLAACNAGKTSSVREALSGSVDKASVSSKESSRAKASTGTSSRKRSAGSGIPSSRSSNEKQPRPDTSKLPANDTRTAKTPSSSPEYRAPKPPQKLTWHPPLTREDGTSLYPGEIQGYRIYFKKAHHDQFKTAPIKDADETSLSLDGFAPGVYHFSISTIDVDGLESRRSTTVRVNVT